MLVEQGKNNHLYLLEGAAEGSAFRNKNYIPD